VAVRVVDRLNAMHRERDANVVAQRSTGMAPILVKQQVVDDAFRKIEIWLVAMAGLRQQSLPLQRRELIIAIGDGGEQILAELSGPTSEQQTWPRQECGW
jgi:hypothetical protein